MLTSEEKAVQLKKEIALIESEVAGFQRELEAAGEKRQDAVCAIERKQIALIRELGLLKAQPWHVRPTGGLPGFYLGGWYDRDHPALNEIVLGDYHHSLRLEDFNGDHRYADITLRWDDDDIAIIPNGDITKDEFLTFIEDWGLDIDSSGLDNTINTLHEKADNLQVLVDIF